MNRNGTTRAWKRGWLGHTCLLLAACCWLPCGVAVAADAPTPRGRIEAMTPVEREELRQCRERFASLEPERQERLRRLHRQIDKDPRREDLRGVMHRYCQWVGSLPQFTQAELLELPPAERIARIKKIQEQEREHRAMQLSAKDAKALRRWVELYAGRLAKHLPRGQQKHLAGVSEAERRQYVVSLLLRRWKIARDNKKLPVKEQDLAELRSMLSPTARKLLESKPAAVQWAIVEQWMRRILLRQRDSRHRSGMILMRQVSDEELARFFEEQLTAEERDRLLGLPADVVQRALRQRYIESKYPNLKHPKPRMRSLERPMHLGPHGPHPGNGPHLGRPPHAGKRQPPPPEGGPPRFLHRVWPPGEEEKPPKPGP